MTSAIAHTSPFTNPLVGWLQKSLDQTRAWLSTVRSPLAARPLTAREEADQLRAMANDLVISDPSFAQDLYAAADRHELA